MELLLECNIPAIFEATCVYPLSKLAKTVWIHLTAFGLVLCAYDYTPHTSCSQLQTSHFALAITNLKLRTRKILQTSHFALAITKPHTSHTWLKISHFAHAIKSHTSHLRLQTSHFAFAITNLTLCTRDNKPHTSHLWLKTSHFAPAITNLTLRTGD